MAKVISAGILASGEVPIPHRGPCYAAIFPPEIIPTTKVTRYLRTGRAEVSGASGQYVPREAARIQPMPNHVWLNENFRTALLDKPGVAPSAAQHVRIGN